MKRSACRRSAGWQYWAAPLLRLSSCSSAGRWTGKTAASSNGPPHKPTGDGFQACPRVLQAGVRPPPLLREIITMTLNSALQQLIDNHETGHALAQSFYADPGVFSLDRETILDESWHLAGHVSRVPRPGDYFLFNLFGEEIIINRAGDDKLYAHYNVCRHRGLARVPGA